MIESYWHKETELRIGRVDKPHKKRHPALPDARLVQLLLEILASPVTACPFASHRHRGGVRFFRTREDPNHPPHVQGRRGQKAMLVQKSPRLPHVHGEIAPPCRTTAPLHKITENL